MKLISLEFHNSVKLLSNGKVVVNVEVMLTNPVTAFVPTVATVSNIVAAVNLRFCCKLGEILSLSKCWVIIISALPLTQAAHNLGSESFYHSGEVSSHSLFAC